MSVVNLLGINVMNNPAKFGDPYTFEITFECLEPLQKGKRITTKSLHDLTFGYCFTNARVYSLLT